MSFCDDLVYGKEVSQGENDPRLSRDKVVGLVARKENTFLAFKRQSRKGCYPPVLIENRPHMVGGVKDRVGLRWLEA